MTLTKKEQERYAALAAIEEQPEGEPTGGEGAHGADAAAIGQQMLLDALGSPEAVQKAVGGRPRVDGQKAGAGPSPTLRARIGAQQRTRFLNAAQTLGITNDSDALRTAVEEFTSRHDPATGRYVLEVDFSNRPAIMEQLLRLASTRGTDPSETLKDLLAKDLLENA